MNLRIGTHHVFILFILLISCERSLEEDLWKARQLALDSEHSRTVSEKAYSDPCMVYQDLYGDDDLCMIRGFIYSHLVYPHTTGCYCYYYTNTALFTQDVRQKLQYKRCNITFNNTTLEYPCFQDILTGRILQFDYNNPDSVQVLGSTFLSSNTTEKWKQCASDGHQCCKHMDKDSAINPGEGYCPAIWDGYTCFNKAQAGSIQHEACPSFMYSASPPTCQQYNDKVCFENATWNQQTDYGPCTMNPVIMMRNRNTYYVIMLSISIGICIPALITFISYRKMRITRINLHRNLILAIVIRNIVYIAAKEAIIIDALDVDNKAVKAIVENSVWCRTISFMEKLSCSAVYSCMLLEGIFLHRIIASAFKGEPKMRYYYVAAIGITCVPVMIWTIFTAINNNINCWQIDANSYIYIVDGPRIAALAINALLMLDIVRVLCTKLKKINTAKAVQIRRMTRATILLIPLFGIQFLITSQRPVDDDCDLEQAYYYFFYTMDGLQGGLVALLYCFLNKEVQMQLLRTYANLMTRLCSLFGKQYTPKHRPTWTYSEHRVTANSFVNPDDMPFRTSTSYPKNSGLLSDVMPSKPRRSATCSENGHVYGNVSDILGSRTPRTSISSTVRSIKVDDMPKRNFPPRISIHEADKPSVIEENQEDVAEDKMSQKQLDSAKITEVSKSFKFKLGNSDEMLLHNEELSKLPHDGVNNLTFTLTPEDVSSENTLPEPRRSNDSGNYSITETNA